MLKAISSWFARRKNDNPQSQVFRPACHVYIRADGTWIFPMNIRGGIGVMVGPAIKVLPEGSPSALGEATQSAMAQSRCESWLPDGSWQEPKAAKEAGFKSDSDLERGAAMLAVYRADQGVNVSAWAACKGEGHEPVPGAERTCSSDSTSIGETILELSKSCIVRETSKGGSKSGRTTKSLD